MTKLHEIIVVQRPLEDCFRYLLDFSTIEQWDPGVYRAEKITPGAPEVGTRFDLILNSAGRRVPMQYELTAIQPDRQLCLSGRGTNFSAEDRITLQRLSGGRTQIDYEADLQFTGPADQAEWLLKPWLKRVGRAAVAGMEQALNPAAAPEPLGVSQKLANRLVLPAALNFTERGYLKMADKSLNDYMDGKTVVVTGPTSGLGLATACELSRLGARVALVGRDASKLSAAQQTIADFSGADLSTLPLYEADLSLMTEVKAVASRLASEEQQIDVLINNAGALFGERQETAEGNERCLAINLLAPWLLTNQLLPKLRESSGKVINIASGGMYLQGLKLSDLQYKKGSYDGTKAYARAKRGLVAITEYWAAQERQQQGDPVNVNAMHPGWAGTPGVANALPGFNNMMDGKLRDSRMGADTIVWLASSPNVADRSGEFWFDRQSQPTAVLPNTEVDEEKTLRLVQALGQLIA